MDRFLAAVHRAQGSFDLAAASKAAAAGRVETLLLDADRQIPGRMDAVSGEIIPGKLHDAETDDLLDDLGERVLATGGEVVVVPSERMPTRTGLAAIYRF
jgi:stalled ribosome rescue protein Dom34